MSKASKKSGIRIQDRISRGDNRQQGSAYVAHTLRNSSSHPMHNRVTSMTHIPLLTAKSSNMPLLAVSPNACTWGISPHARTSTCCSSHTSSWYNCVKVYALHYRR
ncbi:hypothetical protein M6B38_395185 [Iris pallida]|uniref:Uncharacterized protein n=1 Tax=Iris pallida TaxID=29817 RepID=A0AAX6FYN6_IRIPA|nr:hypothetical protein M6B38_395185 [Iris pallida]